MTTGWRGAGHLSKAQSVEAFIQLRGRSSQRSFTLWQKKRDVEKLRSEVEFLDTEPPRRRKSRRTGRPKPRPRRTDYPKKARKRGLSPNLNCRSRSPGSSHICPAVLLRHQPVEWPSSRRPRPGSQPLPLAGYEGVGGQGGVLSLLEVVKSQTDEMIREVAQVESFATKAHSAFLSESESSV